MFQYNSQYIIPSTFKSRIFPKKKQTNQKEQNIVAFCSPFLTRCNNYPIVELYVYTLSHAFFQSTSLKSIPSVSRPFVMGNDQGVRGVLFW